MTAEQVKILIPAELGRTTDTALSSLVESWWSLWADKDLTAPRLRYLYTKKSALEYLCALRAEDVTYSHADVNESDSNMFDHWSKMLEGVQAEVEKVESVQRGVRTPKTGMITATAPITVTSGCDPNSRGYRGDPLLP